jgi:uncharacterized protein (TIGR03435 family)
MPGGVVIPVNIAVRTVLLALLASPLARQPFAQPAPASSQAAQQKNLTFDVATVKISAPLDMAKLQAQMRAGQMPNFGAHLDGLRAEYTYMTMQQLLVYAYDVKPYQIVGPDWLQTEHYDIVARLPEGTTKSDAPAMLKALLADRFKLAAHLEDRDLAVFALVVGKDGPKLKDSPEPPPIDESAPLKPGETKMDLPDGPAIITGTPQAGQANVNMGTRGVFTEKINTQTQALAIDGKGVAMPGFVDMVNQIMQIGGPGSKLVVDRTGLKGHYEVSLQLSLADLIAAARRGGMDIPSPPSGAGGGTNGAGGGAVEASDPGGGGGSTVTHSLETLGLKLESAKAPVQQLIIDHAEKTPAEN